MHGEPSLVFSSSLAKTSGTFRGERNLLKSGEVDKPRITRITRMEEKAIQAFLFRVIRVIRGFEFRFGEVTERPKVRHWKCRVGVKPHRGFESRPLRFGTSQHGF